MCPDGSVPISGLSLPYAYRSAATEPGTGLLAKLSRLSNWPLAGLYHRADMLTRPLVDSVQPDWYPMLPAGVFEASTLPSGSYAVEPARVVPVVVKAPTTSVCRSVQARRLRAPARIPT